MMPYPSAPEAICISENRELFSILKLVEREALRGQNGITLDPDKEFAPNDGTVSGWKFNSKIIDQLKELGYDVIMRQLPRDRQIMTINWEINKIKQNKFIEFQLKTN